MRLDQRLLTLGLAPSRSRAQALIKAGAVLVDGASETRPSRATADAARIELVENPNPWVSRAGLKLAHALDVFALSPAGAEAIDVGASTGGFTQVLLARGARRVYAVDVGRDQLHPDLVDDPRVVALSGVNVRSLDSTHVPTLVDWLVADVSFISLSKALPAALALAGDQARLVALVKPQFEVGRAAVGKGGVVKDPAAQASAVEDVKRFLTTAGWRPEAETESPIEGGDGNREFLVSARRA